MPSMEEILGDRTFDEVASWAQVELGHFLAKLQTITGTDLGFSRSVSPAQTEEYLRSQLPVLEAVNMSFVNESLGGMWNVTIGPIPCELTIHLAWFDGYVWIARLGTTAFDEFKRAVGREFPCSETLRGFSILVKKTDICHPMSKVFWTYQRSTVSR